jgi:hypothetical protein
MLFRISRILTTFGILAVACSANTAFGQFGFYNPFCCCPPPVCVQPCYRTVPVTEMRECRQVVQKPVVETKYIDQPVTEYRQVCETKTAEIPTVSYQNVTEYQTVQRDCGRWHTQIHCRPKMNPCQYDCRPDLMGFLNRTQYSLRMAFTPDQYAERVYVPNVVAQQIPVTRQVAVRGTQTINYQVAKVVPIHSTRRVAVNTVRMVAQEIVTQRPVTVFKTVPYGSTYAFGPPAGGATSTTARHPPHDSLARPTAILPKTNNKPATPDRTAKAVDALGEESNDPLGTDTDKSEIRGKKSGALQPVRAPADDGEAVASNPSVRPIGKWVARKKPVLQDGPMLPDITIARNDTKLP